MGRILVPVSCPGCGRPDRPICPRCVAPFAGPARDVRAIAGAAAPWWRGASPSAVGIVPYESGVSATILAWKDHGRRDLTAVMALALGRSVLGALRSADIDGRLPEHVGLVPVPSSALADARRSGNLVTAALTIALPRIARGASAHGVRVGIEPSLNRRHRRRDQAGLSARERELNLAGTLVATGNRSKPSQASGLVLVDDVLTTGASLAEASRALRAASRPDVISAAVVAVTPRGRGSVSVGAGG